MKRYFENQHHIMLVNCGRQIEMRLLKRTRMWFVEGLKAQGVGRGNTQGKSIKETCEDTRQTID